MAPSGKLSMSQCMHPDSSILQSSSALPKFTMRKRLENRNRQRQLLFHSEFLKNSWMMPKPSDFLRSEMLHCRFLRSKKSNGSFWYSSRVRSQNSDNQYEIAYFGSRRGNVLYVLSTHNFARMVKNLSSIFFFVGIIFFAFVTYKLILDNGRVSNFVLIMTWKHVRMYFSTIMGWNPFWRTNSSALLLTYVSCMWNITISSLLKTTGNSIYKF